MAYFKWFKTTWSVLSNSDKKRNIIFAVLSSICISIFFLNLLLPMTSLIADLLRPIIVVLFLCTLRQNLKDFMYDLLTSITITATIFAWVFLFSIVGFFMFRYSFEGLEYFGSMSMSLASMFTLMTTANFPDVMLPAYNKDFFSVLFFGIYLLVGLFFLLNLLLAIVFGKFKDRFQ